MLYNKQRGGFPSLNIAGASDMLASTYMGAAPVPQVADQEFQIAPMKDPQMPPAIKPKAFGKGGKAWQILGIIGDALQTAGGGRATYMPAMLDLQEQTRKERETQQALAAKQAALVGLGMTPEQQAAVMSGAASFGDVNKPPKTWQDNAGNMWREGESQPFFIDRAPKMSLSPDGMGGVHMVLQANPYDVPDKPVGVITPIGDGSNPVPQPPQGAQGQPPAFVTRDQLMTLQRALGGPQQVQNYLRLHNIQVRD